MNLDSTRDSAVQKLYEASAFHGQAEIIIHNRTQNPASATAFFTKQEIKDIRRFLKDSDKLRNAAIAELAALTK